MMANEGYFSKHIHSSMFGVYTKILSKRWYDKRCNKNIHVISNKKNERITSMLGPSSKCLTDLYMYIIFISTRVWEEKKYMKTFSMFPSPLRHYYWLSSFFSHFRLNFRCWYRTKIILFFKDKDLGVENYKVKKNYVQNLDYYAIL